MALVGKMNLVVETRVLPSRKQTKDEVMMALDRFLGASRKEGTIGYYLSVRSQFADEIMGVCGFGDDPVTHANICHGDVVVKIWEELNEKGVLDGR
jgi:hypothetical protein